jgi:hypothetical protein
MPCLVARFLPSGLHDGRNFRKKLCDLVIVEFGGSKCVVSSAKIWRLSFASRSFVALIAPQRFADSAC